MKKITLYDAVGFGIIINTDSGVIYTNQTGGTACLHPEMEGAYIPLRNDYLVNGRDFVSPEVKLFEYFEGEKYSGTGATDGIDEEDISFIQSVLEEFFLADYICIDREKLDESHEAWIHVLITQDNDLFRDFGPYPSCAVMTWTNSD